ncbi:hypothetical protein SUNI508_01427 [Seiridium unicorne]|uniref:Uncharacterized protein n=1 Tax=Seiridium unicorne TaxID=138068 RepID=A0ABR2USN7_9PEZI
MLPFINGPVEIGATPAYDKAAFSVHQILSSGQKNTDYSAPERPTGNPPSNGWDRGCLYDYYLYRNAYLSLVGDVDPRYEQFKDNADRLKSWPLPILIQGNKDYNVSVNVTLHTIEKLGSTKAKLFLADKQGHLFEATSFLEDDTAAMDAYMLLNLTANPTLQYFAG